MSDKTIYICGDSTAARYDPVITPMVGWGQVLPDLLPGVAVENHAMAGRSTRTFLAEGRLTRFQDALRPGDLVLIQFAHNDEGDKPERHTEPWGDFTDNLNVFIDTALARGAQPVLMTPICIRLYRDGQLQPTHGEYLKAIHALAARRGVPLIDLYADSFAIVEALGEEASRALYMRLEKGEDPRYPDGLADDTHTRLPGAERFARAAAARLRELRLV